MTVDRTQAHIVVDATPAQIMDVVADLPAYPEWTAEIATGEILSVHADNGRVRHGRLVMDTAVGSDDQVYLYTWDGDEAVRWSLVRSRMLTSLEGAYRLRANADGTTQLTYELAVEPRVRIPQVLRRTAEKVIINRSLAGLKARVEDNLRAPIHVAA